MSKRRWMMIGALATATTLVAGAALRQDAGAQAGQEPGPEQMQQMMDAWLKTLQPGAGHERLNQFVGEWNITTKVGWDPSAPASETRGTASVSWTLDKHFLIEEIDSRMVMPDPKNPTSMREVPYQGKGLTGYNNFRNVYESVWTSNLDTAMLTMRGTASPDGKTFTYYGEMDEPMMGMIGRTVKYQTKVVDKDTHVFAIYDLAAGDDYKVIEITYKRK